MLLYQICFTNFSFVTKFFHLDWFTTCFLLNYKKTVVIRIWIRSPQGSQLWEASWIRISIQKTLTCIQIYGRISMKRTQT